MNAKELFRAMMIAALLLFVMSAHAQVPPLINYQGQLTDASGNPANGAFTMVFNIFGAATGGTAVYTETQSVTVSNGVFNVLLGSVTPIPLNLFDASPDRYLEITVNSAVLTPRRRFGSVPYAFTTRGGGNGDITAVNAGAGLTGGGAVGDVTLAVANNAVNSAMIQDNTIVDVDVNTNAAVAGTKINPNFGAQNILTTGRIGLGLNNPSASLHILSTGIPPVSLPLAENGLLLGSSGAANYKWMQSYNGALALNPVGNNVGIGTTAPQRKFEVVEDVNAVGHMGIRNPNAGTSAYATMAVNANDAQLSLVAYSSAYTSPQLADRAGVVSASNTAGLFLGASATIGDIRFYTAGLAIADERMRITSSGNVGIAATTPGKRLVVGQGGGASGVFNDGIFVNIPGGAAVTARNSTTGVEAQLNAEASTATFGSVSNHDLNFRTNNVERMRITAGGQVGIGTAAPTHQFDLRGVSRLRAATSTNLLITNTAPNLNDDIGIDLIKDTNVTPSARILFDGFTDQASHEGSVAFFTRQIADANVSERMRVAANGNIGIGVPAPTRILQVAQNSATDPIADAWTIYSSRRWKTNIKTLTNALDKVQRLRGVTYDWKENGKPDVGLIAEEVGEVIPEVVTYEANGKDAASVDYARLVAVLIEAVKEQQKELQAQRKKIGEMQVVLKALAAAREEASDQRGGE